MAESKRMTKLRRRLIDEVAGEMKRTSDPQDLGRMGGLISFLEPPEDSAVEATPMPVTVVGRRRPKMGRTRRAVRGRG
jgi:hypothetical protein